MQRLGTPRQCSTQVCGRVGCGRVTRHAVQCVCARPLTRASLPSIDVPPADTAPQASSKRQLSKRLTQYRAGLALLAEAMQETGLSIHGFRLEDSAFALAALARLRANNPTRAHIGDDVPVVNDPVRRDVVQLRVPPPPPMRLCLHARARKELRSTRARHHATATALPQAETRQLRHFLSLAHAAYLNSDTELFAKTTVTPADLLTSSWEVVDLVPAHFVAVCHYTKSIVVSVRGTWGACCHGVEAGSVQSAVQRACARVG